MNKQELIGLKVQHNMLGEGTITRFKGRSTEYCLIYFNCIKKESMFRFPDVLLDNNIFNQDNYVARVLNQQFSKIDNEYIDINRTFLRLSNIYDVRVERYRFFLSSL